jgi:hypothetical protein
MRFISWYSRVASSSLAPTLDDTGISEVAYEDTEHYAITRDFLNQHQRCLEQLFSNDE